MKKYYCENCDWAFEPSAKVHYSFFYKDYNECPICKVLMLIRLPDYETPAQYKKRTGKKLGDASAVWLFLVDFLEEDYCRFRSWVLFDYKDAKNYIKNAKKLSGIERWHIVCAQSPEPPPDNWRPKEEA